MGKAATLLKEIISCILPFVGVVCIFFPGSVTKVLPYLMGGALVLSGAAHMLPSIVLSVKGVREPTFVDLSYSMLIMGIAFLVAGAKSLTIIGITWGLFGIFQSARGFRRGLQCVYERKKFLRHFLVALLRLAIALLLLFDVDKSFTHHIILLGIDIVVDTVRYPEKHGAHLNTSEEESP